MIKELELFMTDPIVTHFKDIFEMNKHVLTPNKLNNLYIKEKSRSYLCGWVDDNIIDENLSSMIPHIRELMKQNGFETDDSTNTFASEFHYSYISGNGIIPDTFTIHQDDYSSIEYEVNTFILYLDVKCFGGELVFYNINQEVTCCMFDEYEPFCTIDTNNPTEISCKAVIFDGSIYHKPNTIVNGHRLSIVVTIPRK
jgi:hypothetical protein